MTTFESLVDNVYKLSKEELKEIKKIIDKQLMDKRIDEIEKALQKCAERIW